MKHVVGPTVLVTVLAAAVLLWLDGPAEFAGYQVLLLIVAALAMDRLRPAERAKQDSAPSPFGIRRRKQARRSVPPQLERIEHLVLFAKTTAFDAEWRLLPLLRAVTDDQLTARHGVDLSDRPDLARVLLGERGWELLDPSRELPVDRTAPGLSLEALEVAVSAIEEL